MKRLVPFIITLVLVAAVGVAVAEESPYIYTVQPGDCLIRIARKAGETDEAYMKMVELNRLLFPTRIIYHPSHNRLRVGQQIAVPAEWAVALGLIVVPAVPAVAPATTVVPVPSAPALKETGLLEDWMLFVLIIAAILLFAYLANRRRVNEFVERAAREIEFAFAPLRVDPCFASGVSEAGAARMLGANPRDIEPTLATGWYQVTRQRPDGTRYSRRTSVRNEPAYRIQGTTGDRVVIRRCGNPAMRIAAPETRPSFRVPEAVRRTIRPEPELAPVMVTPPRPKPRAPKPTVFGSRPWAWDPGVGVWEESPSQGISW